MSFTSLQYFLFLALTAILCYRLTPRLRNPLLLVLSLGFYAAFGSKHLPFLLASVVLSYFGGRLIEKSPDEKRRFRLIIALTLNLGLLFFFKYFNFFAELALSFFAPQNVLAGDRVLNLLLPIGISFFVFQTTGYLMDVYRRKIKAEKNFIDYALFACYFPGIVSGPIQRAGTMLPQYKKPSVWDFENIKAGFLQFLWGAFKKLVIADRIAVLVNTAYAAPSEHAGLPLFFAAVCYSVQIYCDFSAYSDMAIGSSRMLGIKLMRNFDRPYAAVSVQDFWRRWHISLSTWFRDYLYVPLGGSRCAKSRNYLNIIIVFLVSGLWHGAALTFMLWGLLHGVFQVIGKLTSPYRDGLRRGLHIAEDGKLSLLIKRVCIFALVTLAWVFFRADTLAAALGILGGIFAAPWTLGGLATLGLSVPALFVLLLSVIALFTADWADSRYRLSEKLCAAVVPRFAVYLVLFAAIMLFGNYGAGFDPMDFVYFKF